MATPLTIYNGRTSLESVVPAPNIFRLKETRVFSFDVSQNEILTILEAETGFKLEILKIDSDLVQDDSDFGLFNGDLSLQHIFDAMFGFVFAVQAVSELDANDDPPSVGLPKKILKTEVKKVIPA